MQTFCVHSLAKWKASQPHAIGLKASQLLADQRNGDGPRPPQCSAGTAHHGCARGMGSPFSFKIGLNKFNGVLRHDALCDTRVFYIVLFAILSW